MSYNKIFVGLIGIASRLLERPVDKTGQSVVAMRRIVIVSVPNLVVLSDFLGPYLV
jgi:hypothetical protein